MPANIPAAVGRYQVRRELGRGTMGVVYEAHDPILGRDIALKTIQASPGASDEERDMFEQRFVAEARATAQLAHPGIVVVHDVGRDPASGTVFMALELLRGRSLADLLRERGPFEWRAALEIGRRVATALHHAHAYGLVHRDVKPGNIMLLESGEPKVMDFGIVRLATSELTASGQFLGTPLYMSPEQARAEQVDARSDVFALGAVLYELLTGRKAFAGESVTKILFQILSSEPEAPTRLVSGLPPGVDLLLARCLAKERSARYAHAQALAEDIEDVLAGRAPRTAAAARTLAGSGTLLTAAPRPAPAAAPPSAAPVRAAPRRASRLYTTAAALAVLAALATGAYRLWRGPVARRIASPSTSDAPPAGSAEPAARVAALARLDVEFEHSLRSGVLRVFVDDDEVIHEEFGSRVTREIAGLKLRKGHVSGALEVEPGRREVKVQVEWADGTKAESLSATFKAGSTYRLNAKLGGLGGLLKDLSLELY